MNLELVLFSRAYLSISLCVWYSVGVCLYFIVKVNIKRRYVDKSIFLCIWRRVSCTTFLLYTFQAMFSFNKVFINNFFNTTLKLVGAYILLLITTKSK